MKKFKDIKVLNEWIDINVKDLNKKSKRNSSVWKTLLDKKDISQSISIKMGYKFESFIHMLVNNSDNFSIIDVKKIRSKQVDVLFKNKSTSKYYYYEIKSNLDLDSEKIQATIDKVSEFNNSISKKYNILNENLTTGILSVSWEKPKGLNRKFDNSIFMKDFYSLLGYNDTKVEYLNIWKKFGEGLN